MASHALYPWAARLESLFRTCHSAAICSAVAAPEPDIPGWLLKRNGKACASSTGSIRLPTATVTSPLMSRYMYGTQPSNEVLNVRKPDWTDANIDRLLHLRFGPDLGRLTLS